MTTEQDTIRNNKGQFVKGVSGNPGGRNKGIAQYIKERTNDLHDLIDELVTMYNNKSISKKDRVKIIEVLLDRSIGKPTQFQNINLDNDITIGLPSDLEEKDL